MEEKDKSPSEGCAASITIVIVAIWAITFFSDKSNNTFEIFFGIIIIPISGYFVYKFIRDLK